MTTFGWKRKIGQNMLKNSSLELSEDGDDDEKDSPAKIPWVESFKRKKLCMQENCTLKYEEFKAAGLKFAENQKYVYLQQSLSCAGYFSHSFIYLSILKINYVKLSRSNCC